MTKMKRLLIITLVFSSSLLFAQKYEWQIANPSSVGMSQDKLDAVRDSLAVRNTTSLLVIRRDKIVYEWYAEGWSKDKQHYTASLAKSLVGGMSLVLALNDNRIVLDAPACAYIPEWKSDGQKSKIIIRQLATHTSGIENAELTKPDTLNHMTLPGWKGQFWRKEPDPFTVSRDSAPVIFTPGTDYAYSNPGMALLAYAVTASIQGGTYKDIRTLLNERIMKPLDIKEQEWSIGYGKTYEVNGLPLVANWGGGGFTPRATAKIGRLMLFNGNWQGRQLIDSGLVNMAVSYAGLPLPFRAKNDPVPASGLGWYSNFDAVWKNVPRDAFCGAGAGNQVLFVVPGLDLIVVRNGGDLFDEDKGETFWGATEKYLFNPVMETILESPCPISKISAEFAPAETVIRKAEGGDNWPMTWADDDNLYTAYGDGWGFEPKTKIKLSLGLAKVTGNPESFEGVNIRSLTGERVGQGRYGPKASGILMVDGVLYMLVRNTANSQIAWSKDHGQTWEWADWTFEQSFGYPAFLNFGKNYEGARDNYVYIYSHDDDDGYMPADQIVLARVPKDQISNRNSYDFFVGLDTEQQPRWHKDVRLRAGVFKNPGLCYRMSVSYNPGLQKYFLIHINFGKQTRFYGGFGMYESDEPWGPWRTVYFTREWDMGPGETMCMPTKWMSKDGKAAHVVFSGEDAFSVRKVKFVLKE